MRTVVLLLCVIGFASGAEAEARHQPTGNDMFQGCSLYADVRRVTDPIEAAAMGDCIGYFDVVRRTMFELPTVGVCVPDGVVQLQLARVVVKYLKDHPERLQMDMDALALTALATVWPCKR